MKNVTHLDQYRLLHTAEKGSIHHHYWLENLPNINVCHDENCRSSSSIDSLSVVESSGSDGCAASCSIDEFEVSDTESQGHSTERDNSSSIMEFSSSSSLSDKSDRFIVQEGPSESEQITDGNVSSSAASSSGNESQLQQHQPLLFFVIGLFVGLSLGFFTCEFAAVAD